MVFAGSTTRTLARREDPAVSTRLAGPLWWRGFRAILGLVVGALLHTAAAVMAAGALEGRGAQAALRRLRRHVRAALRRAGGRTGPRSLELRVAELQRGQGALLAWLLDQGILFDGRTDARPPDELIVALAVALLDRGDALDAYALLERHGAWALLDQPTRWRLVGRLQKRGYFARALRVAAEAGTPAPARRAAPAFLEGSIAVMSGARLPALAPRVGLPPWPGRILHVVGNSLPTKQSGYTLRTHYTVLAQRDAGMDPHVVTQMGFPLTGDGAPVTEVDGIPYHRIAGPERGSVPFDEWLTRHVEAVSDLVGTLRPAVLHAASDFINAQTAELVGRAHGIPVVYESRGFWEETWLSRQAQTYGWDLARLAARHGLPDAYTMRRATEDRLRCQADRVVTLAEVMADRIEAGGVPRERIAVIPNAVDVAAFPLLTRDRELAARLGIAEDATVIGYISSVVEYEGIDDLVSAYARVRAAAPGKHLRLLIVGDGLARPRVMRQAESLGLTDAIFTGMVPHDEVLAYYGLIDLFVVPRKPVEVCHLVTPLKPFEAFATGRTVVLSDVRALAAIAAQSGAAAVFRAGDEASLADVLLSLLDDPDRCRELADRGARWVRAERSWATNAKAYLRLYADLGALRPDQLGALRPDQLGALRPEDVGAPRPSVDGPAQRRPDSADRDPACPI